MTKKSSKNWYKLDNTAKMYPMLMTENSQNSFRLNIELYETVDPDILKQSVIDVLERYPTFKVRLQEGFFWFYLEENSKTPEVKPENGVILNQINSKSNYGYPFRTSYYKNNIIIEYFHILSDGKGALEFGKSVAYQYLSLLGKKINNDENMIITINSPYSAKETEDSFLANYKHTKLKDLNLKELKGDECYRISGSKTMKCSHGVIRSELPLDKLLALAKERGVSLTVFIASVLLHSIFNVCCSGSMPKKPIVAFVPIDLRNYYKSKTLRNFVMYSRLGIRKGDKADTLEDIINCVSRDLKKDTTKEAVANKMLASVRLQKLLITRLLPLPLKFLIFKYGKKLVASNKHSITFSNVGRCDMPEDMRAHIKNVYYTLNTSPNLPIACGLLSYGNICNIVFTRQILETDIETDFFRTLSDLGVTPILDSNYWELNKKNNKL